MTQPDAPRWLITGGTGFLGSHIARRLLEEGIHPVLFDVARRRRRKVLRIRMAVRWWRWS